MPLVKYVERKCECTPLPSIVTSETSHISYDDCFAAMQIIYIRGVERDVGSHEVA